MARDYVIEIDERQYHGRTASAKEQFEALHIALRTGIVPALRDGHSDMAMVTAFAGLSMEDVRKLETLLVKPYVADANEVPVAANLFQDRVEQYYLLIARVMQENLGGFWQLRRQTTGGVAAESGQ